MTEVLNKNMILNNILVKYFEIYYLDLTYKKEVDVFWLTHTIKHSEGSTDI